MNYQNEIHSYYRRREDLYSAGARTEGQLRRAFETLLEQTADRHSMLVIAELTEAVESGRNIPYNAKQENYNFLNPNRAYEFIDRRIKETYVKEGTAQNKNGLYDMYVRFVRWASDRLGDNGILAFVSNSSFLDGAAFDGLRKCISKDFNELYVVNTKGNARMSGEQRRKEGGNVFENKIRVGIAIYFLVRKKGEKQEKKHRFRVYYKELNDYIKDFDKLDWLLRHRFEDIEFRSIIPTEKQVWLNQSSTDWDRLLPLVDKKLKKGEIEGGALFRTFSRGVASQRDEWVYDFDKENLAAKMQHFTQVYNEAVQGKTDRPYRIKWDRELNKYKEKGIEKVYSEKQILRSLYRPFVAMYFYYDTHFNGMTYQWPAIHREGQKNRYLGFSGIGSGKPFQVLASDTIAGLDTLEKSQYIPLYYWEKDVIISTDKEKKKLIRGKKHSNVTPWGLKQFREHYGSAEIQALDIWHYCYAVLHSPAYRSKYALDLKRSLPRIPLRGKTQADFEHYAKIGAKLADLHIGYETVEPFALVRKDAGDYAGKAQGMAPEAKLKSKAAEGRIVIDTQTTLEGISQTAWDYRLGNRSAIDWVLERYRLARKAKDATIAQQFHSFDFSVHKEQVIDLLSCVVAVSLKSLELIKKLEQDSLGVAARMKSRQ
ncbi:MAG: type ISP restriction/modification enzyme [Spirochaetota bacterium]